MERCCLRVTKNERKEGKTEKGRKSLDKFTNPENHHSMCILSVLVWSPRLQVPFLFFPLLYFISFLSQGLTIYNRTASSSPRSCLCLLSAGVVGVCLCIHLYFFLKMFEDVCSLHLQELDLERESQEDHPQCCHVIKFFPRRHLLTIDRDLTTD